MREIVRGSVGVAGWLVFGLALLSGAEPKDAPLTAEQRRDLEQQAAAKEKEAKTAADAEDFAKARAARQAVVALRTQLHGAADWRVTDARLALADVDVLAKLDAAQRGQLREAEQLNVRGGQLSQKGKYADALVLLRQALTIREKLLGEEHPATVQSYNEVAVNLNAQGQYAAAEPLFRQALAIRQKTLGEEHPHTANSYNNLAVNLNAQGQYAAAESLYRQALAIRQKTLGEEHPHTATGYNNLAYNLNAQGKYADAEPLYRKALAINRKVLGEEHPNTATSCNNLAANLNAQGKYADAEPLCRQALAIRQKALGEEHPDMAQSYNNLAVNLQSQAKYADAEPLLRKALAFCQKALGEEHPATATSYNNVAYNLNAQGKYADAEPLCRQALAIWQKTLGEEHPDTALSYYALALNLNAQGKYAEAAKLSQVVANSFQKARGRIAFSGLERVAYSTERSPLLLLATLSARTGQPADAWRWQEESLGRGLFDDLTARNGRRLTEAERRKEDDLRGRLDQLDKQLTALAGLKAPTADQQNRRDDLLRQLNQSQQDWAQLQNDLAAKYGPAAGQVYDLPRIQKQLPANAALLAWLDRANPADSKGDHWACLVRVSGPPVWVRLAGSGPNGAWIKADDDLPEELRTALRKPASDNAWQEPARRLTAQRLAPLEEHLRGGPDQPAIKHLIILPSSWMRGVPIEVLTDRYSISYAPSGTLFAYLRERGPSSADSCLLALGDPVFVNDKRPATTALEQSQAAARAGLAPLPGSRREVQALARLFPHTTLLLGSDASEQQLDKLARADDLKQYRYLHLATHGQANPSYGPHSFLALANDHLPDPLTIPEPGHKLYDGRLTAEQLLAWQLDADLVTLSACETGLGRHEGGEGYVGFAQPLFLAGARSVVLSQWKVDDAATALLMQRFYQNLLGKRSGLDQPLGKAAALAEAKQWLRLLSTEEVGALVEQLPRTPEVQSHKPVVGIRPFAHPYYWAGFILAGDPGDLHGAVPVLADPPVATVPPAPTTEPQRTWWPWALGGAIVALVGLLGWRWRRKVGPRTPTQ